MNWLLDSVHADNNKGLSDNTSKIDLLIRSETKAQKNRKINYWTLDEDEKLGNLAKETNYNWKEIAKSFLNRNPEEIEDRWMQRFNPAVTKAPWTVDEDILLKNMHQKFGAKWKLIAKFMPGRLPSVIKNRFYSSVNKRIEKNSSPLIVNPLLETVNDDILLESLLNLSDDKPTVLAASSSVNNKGIEKKNNSQDELLKTENKMQKIEELYSKVANLENFIIKAKETLKKHEYISQGILYQPNF